MSHSRLLPEFCRIIPIVFVCFLWFSGNQLSAQVPQPPPSPQDAPAKTDSTATPTPAPSQKAPNVAIAIRDTPTPFKGSVNLVSTCVGVIERHGTMVTIL